MRNLTRTTILKAAEARRTVARENSNNRRATELALLYRQQGLSYHHIAEALNTNGHRTRRGCSFTACTVEGLIKRAELTSIKQAA
jgi:hypothetical protein